MSQPVVVAKLRALLDPNTGAAIQKNPRCVAPSGIALVVLQVCARARSFLVALYSALNVASPFSLQLQRACCMTAFADCPGESSRGEWSGTRVTCERLGSSATHSCATALGRVTLRDKGLTVAVGHVVQVAK